MTFNDIEQEVAPYKNTLVIINFRVVLLLGCADDGEDYYYQVCENVSMGRDKHWMSSCVMGFIPLKGHINVHDYEHMAAIWNRNSGKTVSL
jgi:hypothetical protein